MGRKRNGDRQIIFVDIDVLTDLQQKDEEYKREAESLRKHKQRMLEKIKGQEEELERLQEVLEKTRAERREIRASILQFWRASKVLRDRKKNRLEDSCAPCAKPRVSKSAGNVECGKLAADEILSQKCGGKNLASGPKSEDGPNAHHAMFERPQTPSKVTNDEALVVKEIGNVVFKAEGASEFKDANHIEETITKRPAVEEASLRQGTFTSAEHSKEEDDLVVIPCEENDASSPNGSEIARDPNPSDMEHSTASSFKEAANQKSSETQDRPNILGRWLKKAISFVSGVFRKLRSIFTFA